MMTHLDFFRALDRALPRFAEIALDHPASPFADDDGKVAFKIRSLFDSEIRAILAVGDDDPFVKLLHGALCYERKAPTPEDVLDIAHRCLIAMTGVLHPNFTRFAAMETACDDLSLLIRLSDEILNITAQAAGFEDLSAVPRLH